MKKYSIFCALLVSNCIMPHEPSRPIDDCISSEYELKVTFSALQKVHALAVLTAQQAKPKGVSWLETFQTDPNQHHGITKAGLYLHAGQFPTHLSSPWGAIKIYGEAAGWSGDSISFVFDSFRTRLQLKFVKNTCEDETTNRKFEASNRKIKTKFYIDNWIPLSKHDLDTYRGTDTKVLANWYEAESIYEVASIDGWPLPKAEFFTKQTDLSDKVRIRAHWKTMVKKHAEESKKITSKL